MALQHPVATGRCRDGIATTDTKKVGVGGGWPAPLASRRARPGRGPHTRPGPPSRPPRRGSFGRPGAREIGRCSRRPYHSNTCVQSTSLALLRTSTSNRVAQSQGTTLHEGCEKRTSLCRHPKYARAPARSQEFSVLPGRRIIGACAGARAPCELRPLRQERHYIWGRSPCRTAGALAARLKQHAGEILQGRRPQRAMRQRAPRAHRRPIARNFLRVAGDACGTRARCGWDSMHAVPLISMRTVLRQRERNWAQMRPPSRARAGQCTGAGARRTPTCRRPPASRRASCRARAGRPAARPRTRRAWTP